MSDAPVITNIQKYSIHDGEGIRTTVFFKGCPLKCRWCHNPETQTYHNCPMFYAERCTGCASCINACPEKAISLKVERAATDLQKCVSAEPVWMNVPGMPEKSRLFIILRQSSKRAYPMRYAPFLFARHGRALTGESPEHA